MQEIHPNPLEIFRNPHAGGEERVGRWGMRPPPHPPLPPSLWISTDFQWIWVDFLHVDSHLYLYYLQSISRIFQVNIVEACMKEEKRSCYTRLQVLSSTILGMVRDDHIRSLPPRMDLNRLGQSFCSTLRDIREDIRPVVPWYGGESGKCMRSMQSFLSYLREL